MSQFDPPRPTVEFEQGLDTVAPGVQPQTELPIEGAERLAIQLDHDHFKVGDTLPPLRATLRRNGELANVADHRLNLVIESIDGKCHLGDKEPKVIGTGRIEYEWEAADVTYPGTYALEVIAAGDAGTETFPSQGVVHFVLERKIGGSRA